MPAQTLEYPKKPFSTVNRYNNIASYSLEQIHSIFNSASFLTVSYTDPESPYPVSLPMIGQMGSFERPSADTGDVLDLYMHGYISARLLKAAGSGAKNNGDSGTSDNNSNNDNNAATTTGDEKKDEGLPVTVSATLVDGLVLSLTPYNHSYNYRSAALFGRAAPVTDPAERLWAMQLLTDGVVPGLWAASRTPPTRGEQASTGLLRVRVAAGSAKVRPGPPLEAAADLADAPTAGGVWTGVVPTWTALGEPVPGPENRVRDVPAFVRDFVREANRGNRETALRQVDVEMPPKKTEGERDED